jgi:hypothetical protein
MTDNELRIYTAILLILGIATLSLVLSGHHSYALYLAIVTSTYSVFVLCLPIFHLLWLRILRLIPFPFLPNFINHPSRTKTQTDGKNKEAQPYYVPRAYTSPSNQSQPDDNTNTENRSKELNPVLLFL